MLYNFKKTKKRRIYKVKEDLDERREYKYIDTIRDGVVGDFTVGGRWEMYMPSLNLCSRGTGTTNRIGDTIRATKLEVRMHLEMPDKSSTTGGDSTCGDLIRILIYQDKQVNGTAPINTDVILTQSILTQSNAFNEGRFNFLYDKVVEVHQTAGTRNPVGCIWGHRYKHIDPICIDLEELRIEYKSNFGTLADLAQNNIGIMCCVQFTGNLSIDINSRVWFYD